MGRYDKMLVVHIFGGSVIVKNPYKKIEEDNNPIGYFKIVKEIDFSKFEFFVIDNFINVLYMGKDIKEFHKQLKIRMGIE